MYNVVSTRTEKTGTVTREVNSMKTVWVQWDDGTSSWVSSSNVKRTAVESINGLHEDPWDSAHPLGDIY